jgi:hypothetical protein
VCAKLCESKRKEAVIQQSELGAWRKLRWEVNEGRRKREEGGRREEGGGTPREEGGGRREE